MDNRIYGYARVSSRVQNEDRQIEALTKFGVPEQNKKPVEAMRELGISRSCYYRLYSTYSGD